MNFDLIGSMWVRLNELDGEWIIGGALEAHFVQVFAFGKVCKEGGFEPTWNRVCSGRSSVFWYLAVNRQVRGYKRSM